MRFFKIKVLWRNDPIWAPDKRPKIFFILVLSSPRYSTFHAFHIFSVYEQMCSAFSQYTNRFFKHNLSIWTDSFWVFSEYAQQNSVWRSTLFCIFFIYIQIHSTYSQYTNGFIPWVLVPILERPILERPFLLRPFLEQPFLEQPFLDATIPNATIPRRDNSQHDHS